MIGATVAMRDLFRLIRRASACDLNICIEGESGVGKELVATHIHRLSGRSHAALVTLNCGAIPESLLESELFGHERGAFTGADHRRLGKFELAHEGTLFLDEVGDLSPSGAGRPPPGDPAARDHEGRRQRLDRRQCPHPLGLESAAREPRPGRKIPGGPVLPAQ